jgi:hypothetical protein
MGAGVLRKVSLGDLRGGVVSAAVAIPLAMGYGMFAFIALGDAFFGYGVLAGLWSALIVGLVCVATGNSSTNVYAPRVTTTFYLGSVLFALTQSSLPQLNGVVPVLAVFLGIIFLGGLFQALFGLVRLGMKLSDEEVAGRLDAVIGKGPDTEWSLHYSDRPLRMAVFVSRDPWCLYDILARSRSGEWNVDVPLVIGNHADLASIAGQFGVPFHHFPMGKDNKAEVEARQLALLADERVDFIVLARFTTQRESGA